MAASAKHPIAAMKTKPLVSFALPFALLAGCSKQAPQQAAAPQNQAPQQNQIAPNAGGQQAVNPEAGTTQPTPSSAMMMQGPPAPARAPRPVEQRPAEPTSYTIPAGTHITVTTREELSSKTSQPGQSFSATVSEPITVRGVTLVRAGSEATGTVVAAKSQGRFKGSGELDVQLTSIHAEGRAVEVETAALDQEDKGKGKRSAGLIGGGGGGGALIGGLAGGGKGALIGGLLGAGAGTAGAAFTGNKPVVIPAESPLTFRLARAVTVSR